jgi:CheY-like chemotaxis protein
MVDQKLQQSSSGDDETLGTTAESSLREDVSVIFKSLSFINDLLRSILDVNRAADDQMMLEEAEVEVLRDIFEPVSSMIYTRDTNFEVELDCPEDLVIRADKLRLHQVVLNLARNSAKFVEEGFVRLRADVVDGDVYFYIEDSGPGIPEEKRAHLFNRFQKSLDILNQGTGVGLNLVKKIVDLMNGQIYLDEEYRSGFNGHPGARVVINLNTPPIVTDLDWKLDESVLEWSSRGYDLTQIDNIEQGIGDSTFSVLFVDDDRILRKQGVRGIKNIAPRCTIREAASGEAALKIVDTESFDVIFIDQYMVTGVEQSLKGTETVRLLRSKGVKSAICGLSANNLGESFVEAGANAFHMKPFPVKPGILLPFLNDLLTKRNTVNIEVQQQRSSSTQVPTVVSDTTEGSSKAVGDDNV